MSWLSDTKKISIMLLDDHPIIRRSLETVIIDEKDLVLSGCFGHSSELMRHLRTEVPDVLILDYILGDEELDGLSLIRQVMNHYPQIKILMSSSVESIAVIRTAYNMGIRGYVSKRATMEVYFNAIRQVASGQVYVPENIKYELSHLPGKIAVKNEMATESDEPASAETVFRNVELLTPRESEVLRCFLDGMTILQISAKVKRSRKTISGHKQSGMRKLGIKSDIELFKYRDDLFN
ncbi:response regulator transcription factor [Pantoea sp.]|uniref:response regulator transcription factor n=1 Tax=Pantoea sp. TaxID=69393 RepID=UPI0031CEA4CE